MTTKTESFSNFFERLVKSRRNIDKLKELRSSIEFTNKEAILKENRGFWRGYFPHIIESS